LDLRRGKVAGGRRMLHNEELRNLYTSPSITRVIKSKRMRLTLCVACMGETRNAYNILTGKTQRGDHSEELSIDRMTILECILRK